MNDLDLTELRNTAESAIPGPWRRVNVFDMDEDGITDLAHVLAAEQEFEEFFDAIAMNITRDNAAHIAAFDPPTVLALIDRVEAAEASLVELQPAEVLVHGLWFAVADLPEILGNYMALAHEYSQDVKTQALRANEAKQANRDYAAELGTLLARALAAEAQVARVRELHHLERRYQRKGSEEEGSWDTPEDVRYQYEDGTDENIIEVTHFDLCSECSRIEANQAKLAALGSDEWGYETSFYPCPTLKALQASE